MVHSFFFSRQRPDEFVEVWDDRYGEREEPDSRFVLLAVLAVEFLEDLLRRFRRAEDLIEQGQCRLIQWQRRQFRSGPKADSRLLQRRDRIHLRQRRERLGPVSGVLAFNVAFTAPREDSRVRVEPV